MVGSAPAWQKDVMSGCCLHIAALLCHLGVCRAQINLNTHPLSTGEIISTMTDSVQFSDVEATDDDQSSGDDDDVDIKTITFNKIPYQFSLFIESENHERSKIDCFLIHKQMLIEWIRKKNLKLHLIFDIWHLIMPFLALLTIFFFNGNTMIL